MDSISAVLERLVRARDCFLEVADDGVDPTELGQIARLAAAHDDVGMSASGVDHARKTVQSVAEYIGARQEIRSRPSGHGVEREARHLRHLHLERVPLGAERDGRDERDLVWRSAPDGPGPLAAEVRVVNLDITLQRMGRVTRGHGSHDLLVHQPRSAVAHAEMAHQRQGRQAGFRLADQVHRQEPQSQRQLRTVHHRPSRQRRLVAAGPTLEQHALTSADPIVLRASAARTPESSGPAHLREFCRTLQLTAVATEEFMHRHPALELDLVGWHGLAPSMNRVSLGSQWLTR